MHAFCFLGCLALAAADAKNGADGDEPRGLRVREPGALPGYTLIAPLFSFRTVLVDMEGKVVHEWKSAAPATADAHLLPNGNLLRATRDIDSAVFEGGGIGGGVEEIAPDGAVAWRYSIKSEKFHSHHDVEPLPNGHVLAIVWERHSKADAVAAGRDEKRVPRELWSDAIYEIQKQGQSGGRVVWEWHVWDHLIQDHDEGRANFGDVAAHRELIDINGDPKNGLRGADDPDWMHCNSIDYNVALDQVVLASPMFGELWVIDHSTKMAEAKGHAGGRSGKGGDLLYRWGNPAVYRAGSTNDQRLFGQHDVQWIEPGLPGAGDFLVFNNGTGRTRGEFSSADEFTSPVDAAGHYSIDPDEPGEPFEPSDLAWRFGDAPDARFFSMFIAGVQRLANGNTLICVGADGHVSEVTSDGKTVWEFWNEIGGDAPASFGKHFASVIQPGGLSRYALSGATRIPLDHPGLKALGLAARAR